jgi:hypothetical protein
MQPFQALLDAGWGERHLDPVTGACPGFCPGCERCWSVDGDRLHRVDPVRCPGCSQQMACFDRLRHDVPQWGTWSLEPGLW